MSARFYELATSVPFEFTVLATQEAPGSRVPGLIWPDTDVDNPFRFYAGVYCKWNGSYRYAYMSDEWSRLFGTDVGQGRSRVGHDPGDEDRGE